VVRWSAVTDRVRPFLWPVVLVLLSIGAYALLRHQRSKLVDFEVPRTAAMRAANCEPLYRPEDGHYQYKYLPAFAFVMMPFAVPPKEAGEVIWFGLTVAMAWWFFRLSLRALPERRTSERTLVWLALLLNGKFLVKELAFGQFNLPLGLLLMGAVIAAQRRHPATGGALVGAAVFVKPYALILVPWLLLTQGWRSIRAFALALAAGLLLPVLTYGWHGNISLLHEWYRTVTETTAPNLMTFENISLASMWAKWIEPGPTASVLAAASAAALFAVGGVLLLRRGRVREPNYLECAYFFVLVPLFSPQGWDYVLLLALPAYLCILDRWREMPPAWRAAAATAFVLTSFTIFDLLRRPLYTHLMQLAGASVGAVLLAATLLRLRWSARA
jgi:hypothetical protein